MKYLSVDTLAAYDKYPFSKGQIKSFLRQRKENGLDEAVIQLGRRIYLKEDLFDKWLDSFLVKRNTKMIPLDAPIIKDKTDILDTRLDDPSLKLSVRVINALSKINIVRLRDLMKVSELDLQKLPYFGQTCMKETRGIMKKFKLKFKPLKREYGQKE